MIVATAGHVDHGKTSLVLALTGVDADRLPEEKRRGLSIDLGFAYLPLGDGTRIGFVDVPGHERFVRNMAAGVGAVDCALLIVAADDGVMPQTLEHLSILSLLEVKVAAIVVTKIDLVDAARLTALRQQLADLATSRPLSEVPVLYVSSETGEGIDGLAEFLQLLASETLQRSVTSRFRMAVDRTFTLKGIGTVVTGSVTSGSVRVGETCLITPHGLEVRVRSLRANDHEADQAFAGQRCAFNITASTEDVHRGDWIVDPALHHPVERADCRIRVVTSETKPLRSGTRAHVHLGTADIVGRIDILDGSAIAAGSDGLAQVVFEQPVACLYGDRFVLRDLSATHTFAGGFVIDPGAAARGRAKPERLEALESLREPASVDAVKTLLSNSREGVDLARYAWVQNLSESRFEEIMASVPAIALSTSAGIVHLDKDHWDALIGGVQCTLRTWHANHPEQPGAKATELRALMATAPSLPFFVAALDRMVLDKLVERSGPWLMLPGHTAAMTERDQMALIKVRQHYLSFGTRAPMVSEAAEGLEMEQDELLAFLSRMAKRGYFSRVNDNRYFLDGQLAELARLAEQLAHAEPETGFTARNFRDHCDLGRNLTIEVLEFFDQVGLTLRRDDGRHIRRAARELFRFETN